MRHLAQARNPYSRSCFLDSGLVLRTPRNDERCARTRATRWLAMTKELLPRLGRLFDPARQHRPIGGGAKALQEVHEAGVVADQDARLVLLDALDDAQRRGGGRGPGDAVEPLDRLRAAFIVGHAGAGAGGAE